MLYGLRAGAALYVLYKSEPKVDILEVVSVSNPVPQFPTYTAGLPQAQPSRIVDIQARRDGEIIKFEKVPADVPIADFGPTSGIVLSESKDAILTEIDAFQKKSERAIEEQPRHQHIVEECKKMKHFLNPELGREEENSKRLDNLEAMLQEVRTLLRSSGKHKED